MRRQVAGGPEVGEHRVGQCFRGKLASLAWRMRVRALDDVPERSCSWALESPLDFTLRGLGARK